jgi:hypothetical protein
MSNYKKLVLLFLICVILGFSYINSTVPRNTESFLGLGSELDSVAIKPDTKIVGVRNTSLPLYEYCMFSSYNTAITGTRADLKMIVNVLQRGCRFIDLEIYSIDGKPAVGYSSDIKNFNLEVDNTIPLRDALNKISSTGFSAESPNQNDPIFINLRVKTSDKELYDKIALAINDSVGPRLYTEKESNSQTIKKPLSKFMRKIVILLDDAVELPKKNGLLKYGILELNKKGVNSYSAPMLTREHITPPRIADNGQNTNVSEIKIVFPNEFENSDMKKFVREYGAQVVVNRFYKRDNNLTETEKIFSDVGSAFVPISQMLKYFKTANA